MATKPAHAYCTLLTSDGYLPGALVLAHSLRDSGTDVPLIVLVTKHVQELAIHQLEGLFDQIILVDHIVNRTPANLYLMDRPDLISTFTKIALWRQIQYDRLVYIDADVVALRAPDELFDLEAPFAAVPDVGWPDCFNSGVMSLKPNMNDYFALLALAQQGISFDGADQGLLNMYFRAWHRLSFSYNCTPSGNYQYVPAYRHFQSTISLVHYIGHDKPWRRGRNSTGTSTVYGELLGRWWSVYDRHYRALTDDDMPTQPTQNRREGQQYTEARTQGTEGTANTASAVVGEESSSEDSATSTQEPLRGQPEPAAPVQPAKFLPPSSVEHRQYCASWDPRREPPPVGSRPEAINFPNQVYTMSADPQLFQPPKRYPEPPQNLSYQTPIESPKPERPKLIFPWEARQTKAVRAFPEDAPPPQRVAPLATVAQPTATDNNKQTETAVPSNSLPPFGSSRWTNVWDEDPGIQRYMANLMARRRAKTNRSSLGRGAAPEQRRPSLIVTDFPTEVERPSLPVTPAPIRRSSFWGEERGGASELPRADGVPDQPEWDPSAKLAELQRRQSQVLALGSMSASRTIPNRSLIGSEPTVDDVQNPEPLISFGKVDFAKGGDAGRDEDAPDMSPVS